jgi:hypothetical protein
MMDLLEDAVEPQRGVFINFGIIFVSSLDVDVSYPGSRRVSARRHHLD